MYNEIYEILGLTEHRLNKISMFEASQQFISENKTKVNLEISNFIQNILNWQKMKKSPFLF